MEAPEYFILLFPLRSFFVCVCVCIYRQMETLKFELREIGNPFFKERERIRNSVLTER